MDDKAVLIEIRGDIRDINAKLASMKGEFGKVKTSTEDGLRDMTAAWRHFTLGLGGVIASLVSFREILSGSVRIFNEFEQANFKLSATFGDATDYMKEKAREMAEGTIYGQNEVKYAFVKTSDSMQRYGITGQKYMTLVQRAMDVGAAKGLELRESIDRIESAMRGEAEASEYLGVTLNDTYMKNMAFNGSLKDQWEKLSDNEKAMYRYQELMNQTAKYVGQAAEAINTLVGAVKEWGNIFIDIVEPTLRKNVEWFKELVGYAGDLRDIFRELAKAQQLGWEKYAAEMFGLPPKMNLVSAHGGAWEKANPPAGAGTVVPPPRGDGDKAVYKPIVARPGESAESLAEREMEAFEQSKNKIRDLDTALTASEGTLSQMRWEYKKLMETIGDGTYFDTLRANWSRMVGDIRTDVQILADVTAEAFQGLASGLGQAVAAAVVHGEDLATGLRSLLKSVAAEIIATLIEIQVQKLVTMLIGKAVGKAALTTQTTAQAMSGVYLSAIGAYQSTVTIPWVGPALAPKAAAAAMTFTSPLAAAAIAAAAAYGEGGISWKPEYALVGEKGPEAHIPLKSGAVPVELSGGGGGNTYHITIAANDARSFAEMVERNPGAIGVAVEKLMKGNSRLRHTLRAYR